MKQYIRMICEIGDLLDISECDGFGLHERRNGTRPQKQSLANGTRAIVIGVKTLKTGMISYDIVTDEFTTATVKEYEIENAKCIGVVDFNDLFRK